jgi:hypothetical protein
VVEGLKTFLVCDITLSEVRLTLQVWKIANNAEVNMGLKNPKSNAFKPF